MPKFIVTLFKKPIKKIKKFRKDIVILRMIYHTNRGNIGKAYSLYHVQKAL